MIDKGGGHYARDCQEWMGVEREQVDEQEDGERRNGDLTEVQGEETTDDVSGEAEEGEERSKMEWRDRAESISEEDDEEEEMEQREESEEEEEKGENNEEQRPNEEEKIETVQELESRGGKETYGQTREGLKTKIIRLAKRKSEMDIEQAEQTKEPRSDM
ncbi:hypothetical protein Q8A67_000010 [Cirrhinus molitorella]|uniref:Uncharacterized protein n=1 Tax=Cirrhinus molitorella TaxID=172907 RepID=A0AA88Q933_9TELE|nr:hypothetical protein Q8A67_000010 [Cirrhinus molitorella]